ncbi:MAG TPA: efflux RND transporter periplasmic adaptor subunit, partial [Flavitalea sp.]|nr:efflux RND transporter periplasmic adaptor subunit [Flavitalea sp.]
KVNIISNNLSKNFSMYKRFSFPVIMLALVSLPSCSSSEGQTKSIDARDTSEVPVFLVQKSELSTSIQIPGELIAFNQVDLYAKVNSFVKKLNVDVGSRVTKGQVLTEMEAPELNSQQSAAASRLESMEALYIASKANYERLLNTSKTPGTISPNDLDMALARQKSDYAQLQSAKSSLQEMTDNRNYLTIRAPFNGVITARNVSAGAYVGPAGKGSESPLFTLQEQEKLRLVVAIPEAYSVFLGQKSEVSFTIKSLPGEIFNAKIQRLAGALDSRLRSQRIEMDVSNTDHKLLPGMVVEVLIPLPAKDSTFVVPKTALVNSDESIYVIKVINGRAKKAIVKMGREDEDKVEIYGNIVPGDTLINIATEEIKEGATIDSANTL